MVGGVGGVLVKTVCLGLNGLGSFTTRSNVSVFKHHAFIISGKICFYAELPQCSNSAAKGRFGRQSIRLQVYLVAKEQNRE